MALRGAAPARSARCHALRGAALHSPPCRAPRAARHATTSAGLTLYTHPASRGKIVEWYIMELGGADALGVTLRTMDMSAGEHKAPAFLSVNPFGKLPALSDGSVHVFESGAALLYLHDRYDLGAGLEDEDGMQMPHAVAAARRGRAAAWVLFANSTMGNGLFLEHLRATEMPGIMSGLESVLSQHAYLEPEGFGVADVAVGGLLLYLPMFFPALSLAPWPRVAAYCARLAARPACAATLAARIAGASNGSAPPAPPTRGGKPA